jgi:coenzyme F420-reducing hydrogenase alpha subunit
VEVTEPIRLMRRLLYCGEWISSHALHVYLLHAPDFLGFAGVTDLAAAHPDVVGRGLRLKQAGNRVLAAVGGRSVHPVNVRVGGFHAWPPAADLAALRPVLAQALDDAVATVRLVAGFDIPELEHDHEYLALRSAHEEYPLEGGSPVTTGGLRFGVEEFGSHVVEEQVAWSNALHARLDGARPLVVGPLARYALNADRLSPTAAQAAREAGLGPVCRNPYRSIVVRAVEIVEAVEEALRILDGWVGDGPSAVAVPVRAGTGYGATEAPRGVLYHRYTLDAEGTILDADIVPPTVQNLVALEADVRAVAERHLDLPPEELTRRCEWTVRNYDPCISCATHLVRVEVGALVRGCRCGG